MTSAAGKQAATPARAENRRRFVRWYFLAGGLLGVLALAATLGWYCWPRSHAMEPPAIELSHFDPAVAAAIRKAQEEVRQTPSSAVAWGRLSMVLLANDCYNQATWCLARAESLDARDPRWPYLHGMVYRWSDLEQAREKFRRAADLCGDTPVAPRLRLAQTLQEQGRLEEAQAQFQRILQKHPAEPLAQLGLARLALSRGDYRAGLALLNDSPAREHTPQQYHALMAQLYQRLGNQPAADKQTKQAESFAADPTGADPFTEEMEGFKVGKQVKITHATDLIQQDRIPEAIDLLEQTVRDYPDSDVAWLLLGRAHLRLSITGHEGLKTAEEIVHKVQEMAPDCVDAHFYMGVIFSGEGKTAAAVDCFQQAIKLKPDYGMAHYNLGQCLKKLGDTRGAIDAFRSAVRCKPHYVEAHLELGRLLAEAGRRDDALMHLRHVIELQPENLAARQVLDHLLAQAAPSSKRAVDPP